MMFLATLIFAAQLDACHVLSKQDVAAVQGEGFADTKLSQHGQSTTCFYQLPTFSKSVSVDVMRGGAREFWKKNLEGDREGEEAEEHASEPMKISGVGSEALWVGGRGTGSLYVRKGDSMLRVSVGGTGTDKEKIARSKKLAQKALKRL